jgi:predicted phage terminase large subunit-like protein
MYDFSQVPLPTPHTDEPLSQNGNMDGGNFTPKGPQGGEWVAAGNMSNFASEYPPPPDLNLPAIDFPTQDRAVTPTLPADPGKDDVRNSKHSTNVRNNEHPGSEGECSEFQTLKSQLSSSRTAQNFPTFSQGDLTAAKAELCKRSFYEFVREFWGTIIPEAPVWNWHIEYLCHQLQEIGTGVANRQRKKSDVIINVPPGTSKTTICSIMFPVWCWVIDDTIKIITGSYSKELSTVQATKSRDIITSDKFKLFFPWIAIKEDQNNKLNYETKRGGARITTSTGSAITGQHAHLLIVDDPQNPELANSEPERETTNNWVSETLSTRKISSDVTVMILVQQRLHALDVTGHLLNKGKEYFHICLPAELNKTLKPGELAAEYVDGLLDPVRLSPEVLAEKKIDMGSKAYSSQINQNPQNDEDSIIKEGWFTIMEPADFEILCNTTKPKFDFYADTAYTEKAKNDPSVILACTKIGQTLYITNVSSVRMEFPRLIEHFKSWCANNGYQHNSRILIEPKANGKSITQYLKTQTSLNAIDGKSSNDSKIIRLNAVSPKVEAGKVVLIKGKWNQAFLSEVTANDPIHDDMRDCLVAAIEDKLVRGGNGNYKVW